MSRMVLEFTLAIASARLCLDSRCTRHLSAQITPTCPSTPQNRHRHHHLLCQVALRSGDQLRDLCHLCKASSQSSFGWPLKKSADVAASSYMSADCPPKSAASQHRSVASSPPSSMASILGRRFEGLQGPQRHNLLPTIIVGNRGGLGVRKSSYCCLKPKPVPSVDRLRADEEESEDLQKLPKWAACVSSQPADAGDELRMTTAHCGSYDTFFWPITQGQR